MKFHIVGLDLSLSSTGVAKIRLTEHAKPAISVEVVTSPPAADASFLASLNRLRYLCRKIIQATRVAREEGDVVIYAIEGPIYPSAKMLGQYHTRAGLFWLLLHLLEKEGILVIIEPTKLKRYVTKKGNAPKDLVFATIVRAFPSVGIVDNNEADALGLASMVARELGLAVDVAQHVDPGALEGVNWHPAITDYRLENLSRSPRE